MTGPHDVAVVTGGARGIGRAVVERLASGGRTVIAIDLTQEGLAEAVASCGAVPVALDVADAGAVATVGAELVDKYGAPGLVVNNAGISGKLGLSWDADPALWWSVLAVNTFGAFLVSRAFLPSMTGRGSGRIVNMCSGNGYNPVAPGALPVSSAYMASKAALIRLSEALAAEAGPFGVQVFAISPGGVKTDMTTALYDGNWGDPKLWATAQPAAELIEYLDTGALDRLTGRFIHATIDDWRTLPDRAAEIVSADSHALRIT